MATSVFGLPLNVDCYCSCGLSGLFPKDSGWRVIWYIFEARDLLISVLHIDLGEVHQSHAQMLS